MTDHTSNLTALKSDLKKYGIDADVTPVLAERAAFLQVLGDLERCDDSEERKKLQSILKIVRTEYLAVFHEWFARMYPHLLYEQGEDKVFWLYNESEGVYEMLPYVTVRGHVMRLMIDENLKEYARESFAKDVLARYRATYPERGTRYDLFDTDDTWFHAANGWVNVDTLSFEKHTPARMSMRKSAARFDPEATCPTYDTFLDTDLRIKKSEVRVIDQFSGLLLTKDITKEKMLVIKGLPGSGKSTLGNVWKQVLGDLAVVESLRDMTGDRARFAGSDLAYRHLCWFDETEVRRSEMDNAITVLVSGTHIRIERKGINGIVTVPNTVRCLLTANNMPMSAEDGIYRRLLLIELDRPSFESEGTLDTHMREKLNKELPGILNRMLRGLADLRKLDGFAMMEGHFERIEAYKAASNTIAEFLDTYFEPVPHWKEGVDEPIPTVDMFSAYMSLLGAPRGVMYTPQRFGRLLATQPLDAFRCMETSRTNSIRQWTGIRLKDGYEFVETFEGKKTIHVTGKSGKNDISEW